MGSWLSDVAGLNESDMASALMSGTVAMGAVIRLREIADSHYPLVANQSR